MTMMAQSTAHTLFRRAAGRSRRCPRRPCTGAGRTSRSSLDLTKPASLEQVVPALGREPGEAHASSRRPGRARRASAYAASLVPVGALPDPGLALEPAAVRLVDVLPARREDVEDEPPAGDGAARTRRRARRSRSSSVSMWRSERNGAVTSSTRSSTGGRRRSPTRRSSSAATPAASARARGRPSSIPARGVDADHADARGGDGNGDPAGADPELDDRPADLARLLDVEVDVLGDARGSTRRRGRRWRRSARSRGR